VLFHVVYQKEKLKMPKAAEEPTVESVRWIDRLPDKGNAWGQGIVQTVAGLDDEIAMLELEQDELSNKIKSRKKLRKSTVKRADQEVEALFKKQDIQAAKYDRSLLHEKPQSAESTSA
jgi:hypothetical protein